MRRALEGAASERPKSRRDSTVGTLSLETTSRDTLECFLSLSLSLSQKRRAQVQSRLEKQQYKLLHHVRKDLHLIAKNARKLFDEETHATLVAAEALDKRVHALWPAWIPQLQAANDAHASAPRAHRAPLLEREREREE